MRLDFGRLHDPARARPLWSVVLGDVLLSLIIIAAVFVQSPNQPYRAPSVVTVVLVLVAVAALPFRRRFPLWVLAVTLVIFASLSFSGALSPAAALAVAVATFGATNRLDRRPGLILTGVVSVVLILTSLPLVGGDAFEPRMIQFVLAIGIAAAMGDATRSRREFITAITERARRAEETRESEARRRVTEERLRIARDLHDVVAHQIAVISLNAGVASSALSNSPEKAESALATIRDASRTVLGEIGDLMAMLRTDDDAPGSASAPQPGLDRIAELVAQFAAAGLEVNVRTEGDVSRVGEAAGIVAYRVVQESLTNAHKHGADHRAHVLLEVGDDELTTIVTNPVDGADQPTPGSGLGLVGLRERVSSVRGSVEAGPTPGGWRIAARIPLVKEESR